MVNPWLSQSQIQTIPLGITGNAVAPLEVRDALGRPDGVVSGQDRSGLRALEVETQHLVDLENTNISCHATHQGRGAKYAADGEGDENEQFHFWRWNDAPLGRPMCLLKADILQF